jgi:protein O-GlcNAc transferase
MDIDTSLQSALRYQQDGDLQRAENIYKEILNVQPENIAVLCLLGEICYQQRQHDCAIEYLKKALQFDPSNSQAYYNLGIVYHEKEQFQNAIICYQKALQLNPDFVEVYYNIGVAFQDNRQYDEAVNYYQKALQCNPDHEVAYYNLAIIYKQRLQFEDAIACYQKVLQLNPTNADAYMNLGTVLQEQGEIESAIAFYQKAIELNPANADAYANLGTAQQEQGQLQDAEICYRHALQIRPSHSIAYSNLLLSMSYNSYHDALSIFTEHVRFANQIAEPLYPDIPFYLNERIPSRPLKIGYVSPDFKKHSVAYFIEPVLAEHHRDYFRVFCYSDVLIPDELTKRIQQYANTWRNIAGISDSQAAQLIQKDKIDILIDLSGHTSRNRLLLFARKPAPVQLSWIGYPATTGLSTIDYKIVDRYTDPPGMTEHYYTEKLIYLPGSFLCYLPDKDSPEIGELPALKTGHISFGSFNNFTKISPPVLALWTELLKSVPNARLILKTEQFADRTTRERVMNLFADKGIDKNRIELFAFEPTMREHLAMYNRIDIGLDTFPYNGTTTTCEAMWMGVPVITLEGDSYASRVGVSLLSNVGLPELIAETPDGYIAKAVNLANDIEKLKSYRKNLRDMMAHSPLTDAKCLTANLEISYRTIWKTWCECAEGHGL